MRALLTYSSGLLCVAHNREALFPDCVIEMLKYANRKVLINISRYHFTEEDFNLITREHCDALEQIKVVEDYQHLVCFQYLHIDVFFRTTFVPFSK